MDFKRTSIIKHPIDSVWVTMRDNMPQVADLLKDIDRVDTSSYECHESGNVVVKKIWLAAPTLPDVFARYITPDMLSWTEYGEWEQEIKRCLWSIESHAFADAIQCQGETEFSPALGGRGTRINFRGNIHINADLISDRISVAKAVSSQVLELVAHSLIPANSSESANAVAKYLDMHRSKS